LQPVTERLDREFITHTRRGSKVLQQADRKRPPFELATMNAASYDFGKPIKMASLLTFTSRRVKQIQLARKSALTGFRLACIIGRFLNPSHNNFFHPPATAVAEPKNS
jgi:hypothetical protein